MYILICNDNDNNSNDNANNDNNNIALAVPHRPSPRKHGRDASGAPRVVTIC